MWEGSLGEALEKKLSQLGAPAPVHLAKVAPASEQQPHAQYLPAIDHEKHSGFSDAYNAKLANVASRSFDPGDPSTPTKFSCPTLGPSVSDRSCRLLLPLLRSKLAITR